MSTYYPSIGADNLVESFELQVARGLVPGHTSLNISGYQAAVSSTFIPIWEHATVYTYPTASAQMLLWSTSASDVAVDVIVSGLNAAYEMISETLRLTNGTTGVTTVNSYFRINSIQITGVTNPVGAVMVGSADKVHTYAEIAIGVGRSAMTVYTVPAGHTFYLAKVNCFTDQSNNQITNYRSRTQNANGIITAILQAPFAQNYVSDKSIPRGYPEKTDCQWQCNSSATSQVGLQIEGILVKGTNMPGPGNPRN
jgi:hypothetical protein